MRFYTQHHQFYCGIDLHARAMYVCIMDQPGKVLVHKNLLAANSTVAESQSPSR